MASVTTSLALGAKQAVRGAKLAGKRTAAPKAVNVTAKAQISKGTRPPSFAHDVSTPRKRASASFPRFPRASPFARHERATTLTRIPTPRASQSTRLPPSPPPPPSR